jgi:hypothetical protein
MNNFIIFYKKYTVDDRRIVDIQYVFESISKIKHEPFGCTFSNLYLIKERQTGLYSKFIFKCKICNKYKLYPLNIQKTLYQ